MPKKGDIVMRAFVLGLKAAGMSTQEITDLTKVSGSSVKVYWTHAKEESFELGGTKLILDEEKMDEIIKTPIRRRTATSPPKKRKTTPKIKKESNASESEELHDSDNEPVFDDEAV